MIERKDSRSWIQSLLLDLYRRSRNSALMRSAAGRRAFEYAYLAYKVLLEAGPISRLRPYVAPGTWAIDIGANIGIFTLRFARWVRDGGRVIAVEPETENFASLQRRVLAAGMNGRVLAVQAIAADKAGILRLEINPNHPGDHKIAPAGIPVQAVTLDGLLASQDDPPVSLLKIDVQGAELRVLRGAAALLARCRPALFVEIDDSALREQGSSAAELFDFLAAFGYRPHRLRFFGAPLPLDPKQTGMSGRYQDVLFLSDRPATT
jgi:FkbM family methyltransferase